MSHLLPPSPAVILGKSRDDVIDEIRANPVVLFTEKHPVPTEKTVADVRAWLGSDGKTIVMRRTGSHKLASPFLHVRITELDGAAHVEWELKRTPNTSNTTRIGALLAIVGAATTLLIQDWLDIYVTRLLMAFVAGVGLSYFLHRDRATPAQAKLHAATLAQALPDQAREP